MKRKKSMISLLMACMLVNPLGAYAQDAKETAAQESAMPGNQSEISSEKLTQILTDLKKRLVINDQGADFKYSVGLDYGQNYYNLTWTLDSQVQEVRYGDDKNIYAYSYNPKAQPYREGELKKLPQYSKSEAETIAKDFTMKAFPVEYKNFILADETSISGGYYYITFNYARDNIKAEGINARVTVDGVTGQVTSFYTDYNPKAVFESAKGIISQQEAQNIYKSQIGLKKIYTYEYNSKTGKTENVQLVYVPGLDSSYAINAKTKQVERIPFYMERGGMGGADAMQGAKEESLTPQEQKEIKVKAGLKTMEEAKAAAMSLNLMDKDTKLTSSSLYERQYSDIPYIWSMSFIKEGQRMGVELDAKTLGLVSWYGNINYDNQQKISDKMIQDAMAAGDKFAAQYASKYSGKVQLNKKELTDMIGSKSSTINLNYTRFEKDGYIMGDGINMTYDLNTGKIAGFNLNWTQIQLPDYKSFADEAKVLDKIFTQNKIELNYKPFFNESTQSYDLKLYYSATEKPNLPLMFSAITGERIINQVQVDKINYSDIDQSRYQNEINALSNLGIGFTGGKLLPKNAITQREYLDLLLQTKNYYYDIQPRTGDDKKDNQKYIDAGLLLPGETASDKVITRQEAAKYMVRAAGYEKIAKNPEIFTSTLPDLNEVDKAYKGYVVIATTLKFSDTGTGSKFAPKANASRETALKMIYNYLALQ